MPLCRRLGADDHGAMGPQAWPAAGARRAGLANPDRVATFARSAAWRGWAGHGYLIATDDRIWWAPSPERRRGAWSVDLRRVGDCDPYERCIYLASVLDVAVATIAEILKRPRDLYGPKHDTVRGLLQGCGAWGSIPVDPSRAERAVRSHLGQLHGHGAADRAATAFIWLYPGSTASLQTHSQIVD